MTPAELAKSIATRPPEVFLFSETSCWASHFSSHTLCRLQGRWSYEKYNSTVDITDAAEWASTNAAVVSIGTPGELIAVSAGDVEVYAAFRGARTPSVRFRVFGDGDRPRAIGRTGGVVRAPGQGGPPDVGLPDVSIEVIDGRNKGVRATTNTQGGFSIEPWICGPATIRVTKDGYKEMIVSHLTCEAQPREFGSIVMTPAGG